MAVLVDDAPVGAVLAAVGAGPGPYWFDCDDSPFVDGAERPAAGGGDDESSGKAAHVSPISFSPTRMRQRAWAATVSPSGSIQHLADLYADSEMSPRHMQHWMWPGRDGAWGPSRPGVPSPPAKDVMPTHYSQIAVFGHTGGLLTGCGTGGVGRDAGRS